MATEEVQVHACPFSTCPLFGQQGRGNIRTRGRSQAGAIPLLWCTACRRRFSPRLGTPFWRSKLDEELFTTVAEHVVEGCGVRSAARLCHVDPKTVLRVIARAGCHAQRFHDAHVRGLRIAAVQLDEKRSPIRGDRRLVETKPRPRPRRWFDDDLDEEEQERPARRHKLVTRRRERWDHVCIATREKLVISAVFGGRSARESDTLVGDVRRRINEGHPPALVESDEFKGYDVAVTKHWYLPLWMQPRTPPEWMSLLAYQGTFVHGMVHKHRRNNRVVRCVRKIVRGTPRLLRWLRRELPFLPRRLNTSYIERYNATDRAQLAYKGRETVHMARSPRYYDAASWIAITSYNFCRSHASLRGRTPAQAAAIARTKMCLRDVMRAPIVKVPDLPTMPLPKFDFSMSTAA